MSSKSRKFFGIIKIYKTIGGRFTEEQHRALAAEFRRLDEIGAKLMLTNHDTDLIRELYDGFGIIEVDVRRSINRNGDGRTGVEVIITNGYENRIGK